MNERIKEIRKTLHLTLEEFGLRLGVTKSAMSNIENKNRNVTEQMITSICREFNVDEVWLRTGEGEMFKQYPDDETALIVSELFEDPDNPLFALILDIVRTYQGLDPKSQDVLKTYGKQLLDNLKKRES